MSTDVAQAARLIERWQREPLTWLRDVLGGPQPWSRQAEIIEAIPRYAEVDVASGHSIGKDWLSARIALWWLFTRPNSIVITTAPTERQVKTILWGELRKAYRQSRVPLGGLLADVDSMLRVGPMHYAKGIVSRDASSLQGFHAEHVLLIADEAAGIASYAFEGLESCASTATSRILRIGNPTCGPNHPFARSCRRPAEEGKHLTIEISSTETPNYEAGKELIPGLASREFVDRIAERYGEHSQTYRSRVLGKFPTGSPDSLITLDHIGEARSRFNDDLPNADSQEVRVGVDVARQGPDATSICVRRGNRIHWPRNGTLHKADAIQVARRAAEIAQEYEALSIAIDGGGLGAGPIDALRDLQRRREVPSAIEVIEVQFGSRAVDHERFANRRAELWWKMRDFLRDEAVSSIDDELAEELVAPTFKYQGARIQLEAKDQIKRRLGRSTDRSDALALAISGHESPGGQLWIDHW